MDNVDVSMNRASSAGTNGAIERERSLVSRFVKSALVDPLDAPVTEEFRVGAMALGWNGESELVIIEAHEVVEDEDDVPDLEEDPEDGPPCLRVRLTGAQARAFAKRAMSVVSAGRPPCPFCNLPLEPSGHICPRANGYRR